MKQKVYDELCETLIADWRDDGRNMMFVNGALHQYEDGAWRILTMEEIEALEPSIHRTCRDMDFPYAEKHTALWRTLKVILSPSKPIIFDETPMLACNNGTYKLTTDRLVKHKPEHFITRRLHVDADPKAECPLWIAALDRMFEDYEGEQRQEWIDFVQEFFGVSLVGGESVRQARELRKGLFIKGPARTGKTSLANVMSHLVGKSRVVSPSLSSLSTDFGKQVLIGATAVISDDGIDADTKGDTKLMKVLVTGEPMMINIKYRPPMQFSFDGPVIFTTNELPKINDNSDAIYGRYVVMPMHRQFSAKDRQETLGKYPNLLRQLEGENEMGGVLNWALEGYDRAIERGFLAVPSSAHTASDDYRRSNDYVYGFLKDCCEYCEGCSNVCAVVSDVLVEYAASEYGSKISPKKAGMSLAKTAADAIPGVKIGKVTFDGDTDRSYQGLKLNPRGMRFYDRALKNGAMGISAHKGKANRMRTT